jgi:hypothetical protein
VTKRFSLAGVSGSNFSDRIGWDQNRSRPVSRHNGPDPCFVDVRSATLAPRRRSTYPLVVDLGCEAGQPRHQLDRSDQPRRSDCTNFIESSRLPGADQEPHCGSARGPRVSGPDGSEVGCGRLVLPSTAQLVASYSDANPSERLSTPTLRPFSHPHKSRDASVGCGADRTGRAPGMAQDVILIVGAVGSSSGRSHATTSSEGVAKLLVSASATVTQPLRFPGDVALCHRRPGNEAKSVGVSIVRFADDREGRGTWPAGDWWLNLRSRCQARDEKHVGLAGAPRSGQDRASGDLLGVWRPPRDQFSRLSPSPPDHF